VLVGLGVLALALPALVLGRRLGTAVEIVQDALPLIPALARKVSGWTGALGPAVLGAVLSGRRQPAPQPDAPIVPASVAALARRVAATPATVLLRGESGVGKEAVARMIHALSARRAGPFVKVNCAAVPASLLESEFFGHERGAFTGAVARQRGRFEQAQGGTLFLDEVGELPSEVQAKLLHVLQDGRFARVGGTESLAADVRIVAATNRDLEAAVASGEFRADLYYRLNVVEIRVPPLRDRPADIVPLVEYFLQRFNAEYGRAVAMGPETLRLFRRYPWPGNVRELENYVRRVVVLDGDEPVAAELRVRLGEPAASPRAGDPDGLKAVARQAARAAERAAILAVLERTRWNRLRAARALGISYRALLYKLQAYGLGRADRDSAA
jgi:transcriptional regulator with PAS, ATPase and Fis domain